MQDSHSTGESKTTRSPGYFESILRALNVAAEYGVDSDVELRILSEPLKLAIEHLQALLRDFIRSDIVDADLKVVKPGTI